MSIVTESALLRRINRALAKQWESVRTCREDSRAFGTLGRHYLVDACNNIVAYPVDLETLGRELNVMGEQESVA